jgi:hypothetical protein
MQLVMMYSLHMAVDHLSVWVPRLAGKGLMKSDGKVRFHKDGKVGCRRAPGRKGLLRWHSWNRHTAVAIACVP